MILKKLKLENIRSYQYEEIEFPTGSILLSGGIGTGKTSILLAIEFAFFGLQPGQRGTALLSNDSHEGKVCLELEINGNEIIIERTLKRNKKSIAQDYCAVSINGIKTESSITEIKSKILEILNYPQEFIKKTNLLYRYTVYTPQEDMKQIILENPESRLNILRHVFGIDKYKKIRENLTILTSKLREKTRMLQVEIRDLDENKNSLASKKSSLKHLVSKISKKQQDFLEKKSQRKNKENDLSEIESQIKEKDKIQKEIEKTNILLNSKISLLDQENTNLKALHKTISESSNLFNSESLEETIRQIQQSKTLIEDLNKNYIEISSRIQSLEIKKEEDLSKKNRVFKIDMCPTCLQDVSETHKHNILNDTENSLTNIDKQISRLSQNLISLQTNLENQKTLLEKHESKKEQLEILRHKTHELNDAKNKITSLENSKENLEKDIKFLEEHTNFLKQSILQFSKFDNLFNIKKQELKQAFQKEKQVEIEIAELRKEVQLTETQLSELQSIIEKTENTKQKLNHIMDLEKWLSNEYLNLISHTEKSIMFTLREEFSKLFNKWFGMLTTDAFHVHLDENFTPIISQGEFELDYAHLSGGERTAVALAYRLALNQIVDTLLSRIKTRGLIILDEPTDGFSDQQLDKVRDILDELNSEQLILVSHEQKIESFVDNVIKLKKTEGFSQKDQ